MSKILVFSCLHEPFSHPDALKFLSHLKKIKKPTHVVCLGDEVDNHAISFHADKDPDLFSPGQELEKAIGRLKDWYKVFPNMLICESNHGSLVYRKQKFHGLPRSVFKSYNEILQAPKGWVWKNVHIIDEIVFMHTMRGGSNEYGRRNAVNCVFGHEHSKFELVYWESEFKRCFSATAGCLSDDEARAFEYNKQDIPRPITGAIFIDNGKPELIRMPLNKKGRLII